MSLNSLQLLGHGGVGMNNRLPAILQELQGLKMEVLVGAGAGANIAVPAITAVDTILGAVLIKDPGAAATAAVTKLTPNAPTAGNVSFVEATNAAAGDRILMFWYDKA